MDTNPNFNEILHEALRSEENNFNQKLSEALMRVAELDGIYPDNEEIGVCGKYINDYLLVLYLAQLIQSGDMEIKISPDKILYLRKLLKMECEDD